MEHTWVNNILGWCSLILIYLWVSGPIVNIFVSNYDFSWGYLILNSNQFTTYFVCQSVSYATKYMKLIFWRFRDFIIPISLILISYLLFLFLLLNEHLTDNSLCVNLWFFVLRFLWMLSSLFLFQFINYFFSFWKKICMIPTEWKTRYF